jgi:monofunctional biosynthetic peptidoglycan transglycosylase
MAVNYGAGRPTAWLSGRTLFRIARTVVFGVLGFVLFLLVLYRFVNPPGSTIMGFDALTGEQVYQRWVPLRAISPNLIRAVISSEDAHFCRHNGVDWGAIGEALDRAGEDGPRGASTISMQTAKNIFLWSSRSYVRKLFEFPLTYAIELVWSKPRILEIYLNVAEWGPGVYGAEAAAQFFFRKNASRLTPEEAALMAVTLPDPIGRDAGEPGPIAQRLAARLRKRMEAANVRCVVD